MERRKIEMQISFCGEHFYGCYSTYGVRTVQSELETTLTKLLGEKISLMMLPGIASGCSVKQMPVVFETANSMNAGDIVSYCNMRLRDDLVVSLAKEVSMDFQPLKCKYIKEYEYHIMNSPVPIAKHSMYGYVVEEELDVEAMQIAAEYLMGENDFSSFSSKPYDDPYRTIYEITVDKEDDRITVRMSATGYLTNMVQMIVAELIRVGKGQMTPDSIQSRILLRKPDPNADELPGSAMILTGLTPVTYCEDVIHNNNAFADYYVVQRMLKTDGNIFIIIMRCEDESFDSLLEHATKLAYMDNATNVYVIDANSTRSRIHSGENIGEYTPRIALGVNFAELLVEFELTGTWYLLENKNQGL